MEPLRLTLTGTRPLLMHNVQLADPLNEFAKAIRRISSKRKKSDADHEEIGNYEFLGGMYFDPDIGPYIPGTWIRGAFIRAGTITKDGTKVAQALFVTEAEIPLLYQGPRTMEELAADPNFRNRSLVGVQKNRVARVRPQFRTWSAEVDLEFDETIINRDQLIEIAEKAGSLIGIGDGRTLGIYGRFTVAASRLAAA